MALPAERKQILQWLASILALAGDGAFAVDGGQRIFLWNSAAQAMLGYAASEVIGRRCHEVLGGRDASGNLLCCARCPLMVMAQRGERVASRDMAVTPRAGDPRWLNISTLVLPMGMGLVHFFRDVTGERTQRRLTEEALAGRLHAAEGPMAPPGLTRREVEVLRCLVRGASTREIARMLFISPLTARNHIQRILRKLGAASRAEAVAIALRARPDRTVSQAN